MTIVEREILWTLTRKVRVLSHRQIARTWPSTESHGAQRTQKAIGSLSKSGLVALMPALAHPELPLTAPVLCWNPGAPLPDFGSVSYALCARWRARPEPTTLVVATREAARLVGGFISNRGPRLSETTHDLHVATVYLWLRAHHPRAARCWTSEHELHALGYGRGSRLPDAMLRGRRGRDRVVEFGGAYSKKKLCEFHAALEAQDVAYEIW